MPIPAENVGIGRSSIISATALDAAVAVGNSTWIEVRGHKSLSVHVTGITVATVSITGSNTPTIPADATHHVDVATAVTADAIVNISTPLRWIKVRCSAYTSGTISAYLEGVAP